MNTIVIPNINQYSQEIINNSLVLKKLFLSESELYEKNLRHSYIEKIIIDNAEINAKNYKQLLLFVYSCVDKNIILENTTLNISEDKIYTKGFNYFEDLGISIQGADSKRTLFEIINILKKTNKKMEIVIKLVDGNFINYKN